MSYCVAFAQNYVYLLQKQDTSFELEAKIVAKIANDILNNNAKIHLLGSSNELNEAFKKHANIVDNCKEATFIFVKKGYLFESNKCQNINAIYFTDNKQLFAGNNSFIGAFYWLKSRPNIVFSSKRLSEKSITLPKSYEQFIEE